jgi:hypothetical protein
MCLSVGSHRYMGHFAWHVHAGDPTWPATADLAKP